MQTIKRILTLIPACAALALAFASGALRAQTSDTWANAANGDWSNPSSWQGSTPPDGGGTATFSQALSGATVTVNVDSAFTVDTLTFADAGTPLGSWLLSGAGSLTMDAAGTINVNTAGLNATISAPLTASSGLTKGGPGVFAIAGPMNIGAYTITHNTGGTTMVDAGGDLEATVLTTGTTTTFDVNGGLAHFNSSSASTINASSTLQVDSGTAMFTGGGITTSNSRDNPVIKVTGGLLQSDTITINRNHSSIAYTDGIIVTGGTIQTNALGLGVGSSFGTMTVGGAGGGTVLVSGVLTMAMQVTATRGGAIQVTSGGRLTVEDTTDGLVMVRVSSTGAVSQIASLTLAGGVTTLGKIIMGYDSTATGTAAIYLSGGTLFVGSGGIVHNAVTTIITATSGVLGAGATWSSTVPMALASNAAGSNLTILAADETGNANDIELDGALSGAGGFTKDGGGTLTLGGNNSFAGAIVVNGGALYVPASGAIAGAGAITVSNTAALGGNGTVSRAITFSDGATLLAPADFTGAFSAAGLQVTGAVTLGATLTVTPVIPAGATFASLKPGNYTILTASSITNYDTVALAWNPGSYDDSAVSVTLNATPTAITMTVAPAGESTTPVITSPATASGAVGVPFSYTITADNFPTSYSADNLPAGLTVSGNTITGTPTASGTFTDVVIRATNDAGAGSQGLAITIDPPTPIFDPSKPATATAITGITALDIDASAGNTDAGVAYTAAGLPAGLSIDAATGRVTGTPAETGVFTITITATNGNGNHSSYTLTLTVSNTVFNDNFVAANGNPISTLNHAVATAMDPTPNSTSYQQWTDKTATLTSANVGSPVPPAVNTGSMSLGMTTSGGAAVQAEALFTNSPVTLARDGDYIEISVTFTNREGILVSGAGVNYAGVGLYNASQVAPLLGGSGTSNPMSGGAAGWLGYTYRVGALSTGATSTDGLFTRDNALNVTGTHNQAVIYDYNGYTGSAVTVSGATSDSTLDTLANGAKSTLVMRITLSDAAGSTAHVDAAMYSGATAEGTPLVSHSIDDVPLNTTTFDALAFGWYTSANAYSAADVTNITVTAGAAPVTPSAPDAPAGLNTTNITTSGFTANWDASTGATGYFLDVATDSAFANLVTGYDDLDVGNVTTCAVTGLNASTAYYYRVRAVNATGASDNSATGSATTTAATPDAPANLATSNVTSDGFTVSWDASTGATGYYLDVSTDSSFATFVTGYENLDIGNVTSYAVTGLDASTAYYYRLRAAGAGGASVSSTSGSETTSAAGPASGTLVWTGANGSDWDTTTHNWTLAGADTLYADGDDVLFDDSAANFTVNIPGQVAPSSITVDNSANTYTISPVSTAGINGNVPLDKKGTGTLVFSATNTGWTGMTTLEGGVMQLYCPNGNYYPMNTGPVVLAGGTLAVNDYGSGGGNANVLDQTITVPDGETGAIAWPRIVRIQSVAGSGTLNVYLPANGTGRGEVFGNSFTNFTGEIRFTGTASTSAWVRPMNSTNSGAQPDYGDPSYAFLANATLYLENAYIDPRGTGASVKVGALAGAANTYIHPYAGSPGTWTIGSKNIDTTYSGTLTDNGTTQLSLTKVGTGMFTLDGVNTYTGATEVSAGALHVTGQLGATAVTVDTGAMFGGSGTAAGTITFADGAQVLANPAADGTISPMQVAGSVNLAGATLNVGPSASGAVFAAGTYTVLHSDGGITGTPTLAWDAPGSNITNATVTQDANNIYVDLEATVAIPPAITSDATATAVAGQPFSYQIQASNSPTSFVVDSLPAGLTFDPATGIISGTLPAGTSTIVIGAANAAGLGATTLVITTSPAPLPSGAIVWSGALDSNWDTATQNWTLSGAATAYADGDDVAFDDTATNRLANIPGQVAPKSITVDIVNSMTISPVSTAGINGNVPLDKQGAGTLVFTNTNTAWTGTTTLAAGVMQLYFYQTASYFNVDDTDIVFTGGTLAWNDFGNSGGGNENNLPQNFYVDAGQAGTILVTHAVRVSTGGGPGIVGSGTIIFQGVHVGSGNTARAALGANTFANFTGDAYFIGADVPIWTRPMHTTGGLTQFTAPTVAFHLQNAYINPDNSVSGASIALGALFGDASSYVESRNASQNYAIGAKNIDSTFSGTLMDQTATALLSLTKVGTGMFTLDGVNTYTGATEVSAGALNVTGQLGATAVTVDTGASFGGSGTAAGTVTFADNTTVLADADASGALAGMHVAGAVNLTAVTTLNVSPVVPAGGFIVGGNYTVLHSDAGINGAPSSINWVYAGTDVTSVTFNQTTNDITMTVGASAPPAPVITSPLTALGTAGAPFTYTITASGNPASFAVTAGALPAGLTLDSATGVISGAPTAAGASTVSITATGPGGASDAQNLMITIVASSVPEINSALTASGTTFTAFSYTIAATNNPTSFDATGLPEGLSVDTTTGVISGTPTAAGASTVSITAANASGSGTKDLVITITAYPVPVISSALTTSGTVGLAFTYNIVASNSPTSYGADGLPDGLTVNTTTGVISGTPTASGNSSVTISATNPGGFDSRTLALSIDEAPPPPVLPEFTSPTSVTAIVGADFSYQIEATNPPILGYGATPLPNGLSLDASIGLITGALTDAGVYTIILTATNAAGVSTGTLTLSAANPPPPDTYVWTGAMSSDWDTATQNWSFNGAASVYADGENVLFDDSATNRLANIPGLVAPATITADIGGTMTITPAVGMGISGNVPLDKKGAGTLVFTSTNAAWTGTTTLEAGVMQLYFYPSGNYYNADDTDIVFTGGTLAMNDFGSGGGNANNYIQNFYVDAGQNGTIQLSRPVRINGNGTTTTGIYGSGTITFLGTPVASGNSARAEVGANTFNNFTGDAYFVGSGVQIWVRPMNSTGGLTSFTNTVTTFHLQNAYISPNNSAGASMSIGALFGDASSYVVARNAATTFSIGAKNIDSTFSGTFEDNSATATLALTKVGTGMFTLDGVNTYTGATTVSAGALNVTGHLGATAVSVAAGAVFGGSGTVAGTVTFADGAKLLAKPASDGTISPTEVTGAVTLGDNTTTLKIGPFAAGAAYAVPGTYTVLHSDAGITGAPNLVWDDPGSNITSATFNQTANDITITLDGTVAIPPVISSPTSATATVGQPFSYQIQGSNSPTGFIVGSLPAGLTFDPATGIISGTPTASGASIIVVGASNAAGAGSIAVTITTVNAPTPTGALVWSGAVSDVWDATTQNWTLNGAAAAYADGDDVAFDDTSTTGIVTLSSLVTPGSINVTTSRNLGLSQPSATASISGNGTLTKAGPGTLNFSATTSVFTGTVVVNEGIFVFDDVTSYTKMHTGPVVISGGTITTTVASTNTWEPSGTITVPAGNLGVMNMNRRYRFQAAIFGSGTLRMNTQNDSGTARNDMENDFSAFNGTLQITGPGYFRLGIAALNSGDPTYNPNGMANLALVLQDTVQIQPYLGTSSLQLPIGSLASSSPADTGVVLTGNIGGHTNLTAFYQVGSLNTDTVFYGAITGSNAGLTKVGTGMLTLAGANTYADVTTVSAGALHLTGELGAATNGIATAVSVATGASFGGTGTAAGTVAFADNSTLLADADASGALAGMQVAGAVDLTAATTLNVSPVVPAGGFIVTGHYILLNAPAGITGTPALNWVYSGTEVTSVMNLINTGTTIEVDIVASTPAAPVITSPLAAVAMTGFPFTYTITGSNNPTSFTASGLPDGLSLDSTTGIISGTPTTPGTSAVALTLTGVGGTGTATLSIAIAASPVPSITSPLTVSGTALVAFSYTIAATNNPSSYDATPLPDGLTVNTTTGVISGTPTTAGTTTVAITAANAGGSDTQNLVITIAAYPPAVITSTLAVTGTAALPFSYQITTAVNDTTSYGATGLPAGLSIDTTTGLISGVIDAATPAGDINVTLTATNPGGMDTQTLVLTVDPAPTVTAPPTITIDPVVTGTLGAAFSYQVVADNPPNTFTVDTLPAGLTIDPSTGLISGTPTASGTFTVTVTATNIIGSSSATFTLTIGLPPANGVWINPAGGNWSGSTNWASGTVAGGDGSVADFSTIDINGVVTVTVDQPVITGTLLFGDTAVATTANWLIEGSSTLTLLSTSGTYPFINLNMAPGANVTFTAPIVANNGFSVQTTGGVTTAGSLILDGPVNFTNAVNVNASGTLIIGPDAEVTGYGYIRIANTMTLLNNGGHLSVTHPTTQSGGSATSSQTIYFIQNSGTSEFFGAGITTANNDGNLIQVNDGVFTADKVNIQRDAANVVGGNTAAGFVINGGTVTVGSVFFPSNNSWANMTVNGGDVLVTGTFAVGAGNNTGRGGNLTVTGGSLMASDPTNGLILAFNLGSNVGFATFSGGVTTVSKVTFGGDPTVTGTASLTLNGGTMFVGSGGWVQVGSGSMTLAITASSGVLGADDTWSTTLPVTLPASNSLTITAADEFGVAHDINLNGILSGAGGFNKTGRGILTLGGVNTFTGAITVASGGLNITGVVPATSMGAITISANGSGTGALGGTGTVNRDLSFANNSGVLASADSTGKFGMLNVTSGAGSTGGTVMLGSPITVQPAVPPGVTLQPGAYTILTAQTLTGSPTFIWNPGEYRGPPTSATASVSGNTIVLNLTAQTPVAPTALTSSLTASGTGGQPFTYTVTANNYPMGYSADNLPDGLAIDPYTGIISGTPATAGTYTVSITVTNSAGSFTSDITITVARPIPTAPPIITGVLSVTGTVGAPFTYQINASNYPDTYTAVPLPDALVVDGTAGLISGTITATGSSSILLSAINDLGTGTATLRINAYEFPAITSPLSDTAFIDQPYSYTITASGTPVTFTTDTTTLPPGLTFDGTATISGTPASTLYGLYNISLTASNPAGSDAETLALFIDTPKPAITSPTFVSGVPGSAISYQITTSKPADSYTIDPLPPGFTFNTSTGLLTGTAPADGTVITVTIFATNDYGQGNSITFNIVGANAAPSNVLLWTGVVSSTWDNATQNWTLAGSPRAYSDGADLWFDDTSVTSTIALSGTFMPNSLTFRNSGHDITLGITTTNLISGTASLDKEGIGGLNIGAGATGWNGIMKLGGGLLTLNDTYYGSLVFSGGTMTINYASGSQVYLPSTAGIAIFIPTGLAVINMPNRWQFATAVIGSGTLQINFSTDVTRADLGFSGTTYAGNATVTTGTTTVATGSGFTGELFLNGSGGVRMPWRNDQAAAQQGWAASLPNATLHLEVSGTNGPTQYGVPDGTPGSVNGVIGSIQFQVATNSGGNAMYIGAITGTSPNTWLAGSTNGAGPVTYHIGGLNKDTTWAGAFGDWSLNAGSRILNCAVYKAGAGILTLTGSHNNNNGWTVYQGGIDIAATGKILSANGSVIVTGTTGAFFGGAGVSMIPVDYMDGAGLLMDMDPDTGELAGPTISGQVTLDGSTITVKPVVTGTHRITSGTYTVLFSDTPFSYTQGARPTFVWSYPDDPAIQANIVYISDQEVQITITGGAIPPPTITSALNAETLIGRAFTYTFTAQGDPSSPTQLSVDSLPAGLTFNASTGVISGTITDSSLAVTDLDPSGTASWPVTLNSSNSAGTNSQTLNLFIYSAPPPAAVINPPGPPPVPELIPDGAPTIVFVANSGNHYYITGTNNPTIFGASGLPAGVTVDVNGVISGSPRIIGQGMATLTCANMSGTSSEQVNFIVSPPPPVISYYKSGVSAVQNQLFTYQIIDTNTTAMIYGMSGTNTEWLPLFEQTGTLNSTNNAIYHISGTVNYLTVDTVTGTISGICPTIETVTAVPFQIIGVAGAANYAGWNLAPFLITVNPPIPEVSGPDTYSGAVGVPFSATIQATNMYPAYIRTYGVTNIPKGLNVDPTTGIVSGSPLAGGVFQAAFVASNVTGFGSKIVTFIINGASSLNSFIGAPGISGNADGVGTAARLNTPSGGVVGPDGSLYVADTGNNSIRKVSPDGAVTTLASGLSSPSSAAISPDGKTLYVADTASNSIKAIDTTSGTVTTINLTGTPALSAPSGLAVDATGNIYVADTGNNLIREINPATGVMTTVAGSGSAGSADGTGVAASFYLPMGVALGFQADPNDPTGKTEIAYLYVADTGNSTIREINLATGAVTTVAGLAGQTGSANGIGSVARFNTPQGITVDSTGTVYVADTGNDTIRAVDPVTGSVITFAGRAGVPGTSNGLAGDSLLNAPIGLAITGDGEIYVMDSGNHIVRLMQIGPSIITPPGNASVTLGATATFTVVASGGPTPTYQWYKDNMLIPGATNSTYTVTNAQLTDVGTYTVQVVNPLGARSAGATLTISNASPSNPGDAGVGGGGNSNISGINAGRGGGAPSLWYLAALAALGLLGLRRKRASAVAQTSSLPNCSNAIDVEAGWKPALRRYRALFTLFLFAAAFLLSALQPFSPSAFSQQTAPAGDGAITGRVANQATNQYLQSAQVSIEGTRLQTVTDSTGNFSFRNVPAGVVRVTVSYTGLDTQTRDVTVPAGATANADFNLTAQVYQMEKFVVAGDREGSARALQEQRVSPTQKSVFAADSFGNIVDNNLGELMKNLPGVTIDYGGGEDAQTMRIRGMDPEFANVTLDGNMQASMSYQVDQTTGLTTDASRAFNLTTAALQNIDSIELKFVPGPDDPAASMGGLVNLRTKSALQQKGRRLYFQGNLSINTDQLNFAKTPGGSQTPDRKIQPGFSVGWMQTFGTKQRLGVAFNAGFTRNYRYNNTYSLPGGYTYDSYSLTQTGNKVTPDTPGYVTGLRWAESGGRTQDRMTSLKLDYQPWGPNHTFTMNVAYNDNQGLGSYYRYMNVSAGSLDPKSNLNTMISPVGASVSMQNGVNAANNKNFNFALSGDHKFFDKLHVEWNASYSWADSDPDPDKNFWVQYSDTGLGMNIFDIAGNGTGHLVQTSNNGQGLVTADDPRSYTNLSNYNGLTLMRQFDYGTDMKKGGKIDVTYPVVWRVPFTDHEIPINFKVGFSYGEERRHTQRYYSREMLTGSDVLNTFNTPVEPSLTQFADPYFGNTWGFGVAIPTWVNPYSVLDYAKANPTKFFNGYGGSTPDPGGTIWTSPGYSQNTDPLYQQLLNEREAKESNTAWYGMLTARILSNLTFTGGVRWETYRRSAIGPVYQGYQGPNGGSQTLFSSGMQYDTVSAQLPNGFDMTDPNNPQPIFVDNPLLNATHNQQMALLFSRQYYSNPADRHAFPNAQLKYDMFKNITLRAAYSTSIGMPKFGNILPTESWNNSTHIVTRSNPTLQPTTSKKYDFAIEYYFGKNSKLTFSLFYQQFQNMIDTDWSTLTNLDPDNPQPGDPAINGTTVISDDSHGFGTWFVNTPKNFGKGNNQGFEAVWQQELGIFSDYLKNFSIYAVYSQANPTMQYMHPTMAMPTVVNNDTMNQYLSAPRVMQSVPMTGIQKRSANLRLSYNGRRFSGSVAGFWVDKFARNINTSIVEITNQNASIRFDLAFNYKISSIWQASVDWRNFTGTPDERVIFDRTGGYFTSGMVINLGVSANF